MLVLHRACLCGVLTFVTDSVIPCRCIIAAKLQPYSYLNELFKVTRRINEAWSNLKRGGLSRRMTCRAASLLTGYFVTVVLEYLDNDVGYLPKWRTKCPSSLPLPSTLLAACKCTVRALTSEI